MRVYQKHAGDDAKLLIKFHWPNVLNQKVWNAIKTLTLVHQNVHFVASAATQFVVYNATSSHILLALTNKCLLASFWLLKCDLSESNYEELAAVLSTKYKHLKDICISYCTMRDNCCKALLNSLFCNNSLLTYIKKLDISFNQLTMSILMRFLIHCSTVL